MVAWLFDIWMLMFWIPVVASAATGGSAVARGLVAPLPIALWFASALALQLALAPLSAPWVLGMVAQSALAISLALRMKLEA